VTTARVPTCQGTRDLPVESLAIRGRLGRGLVWCYWCTECGSEHWQPTDPGMALRLLDLGAEARWHWHAWEIIFDALDA
jgi:hypothetical protein